MRDLRTEVLGLVGAEAPMTEVLVELRRRGATALEISKAVTALILSEQLVLTPDRRLLAAGRDVA